MSLIIISLWEIITNDIHYKQRHDQHRGDWDLCPHRIPNLLYKGKVGKKIVISAPNEMNLSHALITNCYYNYFYTYSMYGSKSSLTALTDFFIFLLLSVVFP